MTQFLGVYVAAITPFTPGGAVDFDRLGEHVDWLITHGVHGVVATGSCGEYATLNDDERSGAVETIIRATAGRVPVLVGTAAPSTEKALLWMRHAQQSGAVAAMALPPINYRPSRREVLAHYEALAQVGLPIIVYNNPFDTAVDLTPDLLAEIARFAPIVGVKEFSTDVRRIPEILECTRLEVLAGADDLALESLLAGATGWIAGLTNVTPTQSVALFNLAMAGKLDEARALYERLLPLFRYDSRPQLVQAIKHICALQGRPMGAARPPRLPLEEADSRTLEAAYARLNA